MPAPDDCRTVSLACAGWGEYGDAYSEITYANFMAGSYPQLFGEVIVEHSTILRYGLASGCGNGRQSHVFEKCGSVITPTAITHPCQVAICQRPHSPRLAERCPLLCSGSIEAAADANYPQLFSNMTLDTSSRANISHFTPPKREWITIDDCVAMDCDGPKHVLVHDLDGTLLGLGAHATLTSRAEFMNQYRMDGKQTVYSIPTKMLCTAPSLHPAPCLDAY